jgi:phosphatidylserine decarboxylase
MTIRFNKMNLSWRDALNFAVTNRIPRRTLTRFFGWFSRIEQPLIRDLSLAVWRLCADLDLSDAARTDFRSVHDCFTRTLKPGARPADPDPSVLVSPSDAIVGAFGVVTNGEMLQVKGWTYALAELLGDSGEAAEWRDGHYVTLRLTSSMYHRFHAPHDCRVTSVTHIPGDCWNVNPPTLARVDRVFCRNERAVIRTHLTATGHAVTLVPVAAILVAGIRLRFLDTPLRGPGTEPRTIRLENEVMKGEEMGWFEHGSTIIVIASAGFRLVETIRRGDTIRAGQPLMRLPLPMPR